MSLPPFDVEYLEVITSLIYQSDGNFKTICERAINDTLKIYKEGGVASSEKIFSNLKVLLLLYTKSYSTNFDQIPIHDILECISSILDSDEVIGNTLEQNILSVVGSLFKISVKNECKNVSALSKFYSDNVTYLHRILKNCSVKNILTRLKVLCVFYGTSEDEFKQQEIIQFFKQMKSLNLSDFEEEKLFAYLVIHADDKIANDTLLFVIPQFIKLFKKNKILNYVWEEVTSSNTVSLRQKSSRFLLVLCYLFDLILVNTENKKEFIVLFFKDKNYWSLIQFNLEMVDPLGRKQAMYLLKKSVDILKSYNLDLSVNTNEKHCNVNGVISNYNKEIMWWDQNLNNLSEVFLELIVILEFLDEQQIHIIKPMFSRIGNLVQNVLPNTFESDFSWIILIYYRILTHESTQIVKWGLQNLSLLPESFYSDEFFTGRLVQIIVPTLNKSVLYYNDAFSLNNDIISFFKRVVSVKTSKVVFKLFVKLVCELFWLPEALFFTVHAMAKVKKCPLWGKDEISGLESFVSQRLVTQNKIVRNGVECEVLHCVINLTDEGCVLLENVMPLLSSFSTLKRGTKIWEEVVVWLRESYSRESALEYLQKFNEDLEEYFNERLYGFTLVMFFDVYHTNMSDCFVMNKVSKIVSCFENVETLNWGNKFLYNRYLKIINVILEENLKSVGSDISPLVLKFIPVVKQTISYIKSEGFELKTLKCYDTMELYIKTFENILETINFYNIDIKDTVYELIKPILNNFEECYSFNSIQTFFALKLLKAFTRIQNITPKTNFCSYLQKAVNQPLTKDPDSNDNFQTVWGEINSEFLETKWWLLYHLINFSSNETLIPDGVFVNLCVEALNVGGYGVLCPLMKILKMNLLKKYGTCEKQIIDSVWKLIMETRKTDEFKSFIKFFIEMLFQKELLVVPDFQDVLLKYSDLIYKDTSIVVVNIFIKHIQNLGITETPNDLISYIISKAILFGPVQRKDEKLCNQVCSFIESLDICSVGDLNTSNEVRASAVQIILSLDKNNPKHQAFAENVIETLQKIENDMNKNKVRYFGDSHVHRVKHRVMQALLLLEPVMSPSQDKAEELLNYVYNSLMLENPQPSVKYQLEWLLIRISLKYEALLSRFWGYFTDSVDKKNKGLCSLMAISYHLCKLVSSELMVEFISKAMVNFLPYCMDQHFEVRLYSQVVLVKLYELARAKNLNEVLQRYEMVYNCILKSLERGFQSNSGKNHIKLQEDFYLNVFHPIEHYSLQTIYLDLPRLANVGSDEWISVNIFKKCGVHTENSHVPLESINSLLKEMKTATWLVERSNPGALIEADQEELKDSMSKNCQKKLVPCYPLMPGLDDLCRWLNIGQSEKTLKKGELIVVASLIDRIPNLGGLARTCEIFGVSEYVIRSLTYLEDKQFTSLSVTAEKWIKVKEVKLQNLSEYILDRKKDGYVIIGAEQTLYSQSLKNDFNFPKKSLLLLGNEKEGIPANLLSLLDICVEIPQVGIIRSLNVHVTGALFIWEYAKQNYFS